MTTSTYKVGPGVLTLGDGPLAVEAQFSNVVVQAAENVASTDDLDLLDGSTLDGDANASYDWTMTGNVVQDDLADSGLVAWSWDNKGTDQPFVYIPRSDLERGITGTLVPVPISVGGDAKVRATSTITWRIVGDPVLGDADLG